MSTEFFSKSPVNPYAYSAKTQEIHGPHDFTDNLGSLSDKEAEEEKLRNEIVDAAGCRVKYEQIMGSKNLSYIQRKLALHKLLGPYLVGLETEIKTKQASIAERQESLEFKKRAIKVYSWYKEWLKKDLKFERNDCTRFHAHDEAMANGEVVWSDGDSKTTGAYTLRSGVEPHIFVIDAKWSALVKDTGEEIRLPYETCVFEFMMSGAPLLVYGTDKDEAETHYFAYIQTPHGWLRLTDSIAGDIQIYLSQEIRAICIALDAEVLTRTIVRAPTALNKKREKHGRSLVRDYHMLSLNKKYRASNPSGGHTGAHKRLHFRRGHWRHYTGSKTWIRWCLAGDPGLGFYDKDYKL